MSILKSEPPSFVKSLEELFAVAFAMKREAATRYAEVAERLRSEGNSCLAEVFERLAADGKDHLDSVVHWAEQEKGRAPDAAQIRWQLPETFDDEGAATMDPRLLSAYRALAMAVRNGERAFAFWSYVAAYAGAPDIRRAAEIMARTELGHLSTLRRERRRAFHTERSGRQAHPASGEAADIALLERRLADLMESLSTAAAPEERDRLRDLTAQARHHAAELARVPMTVPPAASVHRVPDDPVALAELLADRYLEAADHVRHEEALERAQAFAARAINRLAWLRADHPHRR